MHTAFYTLFTSFTNYVKKSISKHRGANNGTDGYFMIFEINSKEWTLLQLQSQTMILSLNCAQTLTINPPKL